MLTKDDLSRFQVQVLHNLSKKYQGKLQTEKMAARVYDRRSILTHGLKAKTNFNYTKGQLLRILADPDELIEVSLTREELDQTLER